jgi:hypothetical protein
MMRSSALIGILVAAGCGYSAGGLLEYESVFVDIFDNVDERRTHEFELTRAVNRELQMRGVRVNDPAAPVKVRGRILEITEPSVVEGSGDVVVVGAVSFKLEVTVVNRESGKEISKSEKVESATFSSGRLESRETARRKVIDRLAEWVVTRLEKDW